MPDVTFTVDQQAPADDGAITTPATGTWAAATYSFLVLARYDDDTTDVDNYGADRTTPAAWENIVVAANDTVIIPVTLDTVRAFTFVVLRQTAATYDPSAAGAIIDNAELTVTQSAASTYSISIDSGATSANLTIGAAANTLSFSPPATPDVIYRDPNGRNYQGKLLRKSFIDDRIIEQLSITANAFLSVGTGLTTLQRWLKNHVYCKLEFPSGATSYFDDTHGFLKTIGAYDTRTDKENYQIVFDVDAESVS